MTLPACPKIDCHIHAIDPLRFPYEADTPYRPSGQEIAPAAQLIRVFDVFDVRHALIVATNTGYGSDSSILLDTLKQGGGRFRGVAVVDNDVDIDELARLKAAGVIGVAFNVPFHGADYYRSTAPLLEKLVLLDLFLQIQVEQDQLLDLLPLIEKSDVRLVIDHCGRPSIAQGLTGRAFQALLAIGRGRDAHIKLSGYYKFSEQPHPYEDAWPFVAALVEAFTLDRCVWGSDYPFLRAPERLDYGPLLAVLTTLFPDADDLHRLLWRTPARLLGVEGAADQPG
ncbi:MULTISPECIES: amidohydrolase family protein [unclassified Bradyrhizobium]|uniref:amidohydrolase family protein n=1 Tax=unclassified Bradyrhizobium TaxID=2631580 RepID=UPI0024790CCA|nr:MULTISPECIES: amidohydrolase family protein [unclassified Bradyrhizobium]WGR73409.1 amidohydrolase family protein [Bradyrhizobium sp. ISRA426]WGR78246.1 amidohydrolase family protein [Bradyrhizobium sp. ISRA430]WGR88647.1 amidohydrolase family protein [Bradyrhizobium sp. ISRA432]